MNASDNADQPNDSEPRPWRPTTDELMNAIEKASAERRADCPAFVEEFVEMYAAEKSVEDLDQEWVQIVNEYPWYAEDVLHCVEAILRDENRPLGPWVCDAAVEASEGGDVERVVSQEERQALGRQWLQDLLGRFRPVFDQLSRS